MTHEAGNRLGPLSGILYPLLAIAGVSIAGGSPDLGASMQTISTYVAQHPATSQRWLGVSLEIAGLFAFALFATHLRRLLREAEGEAGWLSTAGLGAAFLSVSLKLASAMPGLEAFYRARQLNPQLAATLIDMNNLAFTLTWAIDGFFLALVATAALRTGALPRWLGWAAAAAALASLAAVALAATGAASALAAGFTLWTIATGLLLLRRGSMRPARATAAVA